MSEIETRQYLANGQKTTPAAKEAIEAGFEVTVFEAKKKAGK